MRVRNALSLNVLFNVSLYNCWIRKKASVLTGFHCQTIAVTLTSNYAAFNIIALLYRVDMGEKYFCIKVGVTDNVKDFLIISIASSSL